jgi:hypothetical protein
MPLRSDMRCREDRRGPTAAPRGFVEPAEAHTGRWRGRGASRSGSVSITTTDALFAPKVQRKVSNAVAGLAAAGSSLDRREIAASGLFSLPIAEFESDQPGILNSPAVMLFGLPRRQRLPKSLPQLHIRHTAAQTRTVSTAQFQPNPRKLWRQFKWILFLTGSGVRVRYAQPGSPVSVGCVCVARIRATFPKVSAPPSPRQKRPFN